MIDIYEAAKTPVTELGLTTGVYWTFMTIAGDALYSFGTGDFGAAIEARKGAIDWKTYFKAKDNIDGPLDIAQATFDISMIDFTTVGSYAKGIKVGMIDYAGNTTEVIAEVIVE